MHQIPSEFLQHSYPIERLAIGAQGFVDPDDLSVATDGSVTVRLNKWTYVHSGPQYDDKPHEYSCVLTRISEETFALSIPPGLTFTTYGDAEEGDEDATVTRIDVQPILLDPTLAKIDWKDPLPDEAKTTLVEAEENSVHARLKELLVTALGSALVDAVESGKPVAALRESTGLTTGQIARVMDGSRVSGVYVGDLLRALALNGYDVDLSVTKAAAADPVFVIRTPAGSLTLEELADDVETA